MDMSEQYHYERIDMQQRTKPGQITAGWALFALVLGGVTAVLA